MGILLRLIKFMQVKQFLVSKLKQIRKWKKENSMPLKHLDQLEKVLWGKKEIVLIIWKTSTYQITLKYQEDQKLFTTLSIKRYILLYLVRHPLFL